MAVSMQIQADPVPLREDPAGTIRVGESRVLLDLVIRAYQEGHAPEVIVHKFPTLKLADVHAVIAYYLRHSAEVEEYLRRREKQAVEMRCKIEAEMPIPAELRERIQKRRMEAEKGHVPSSQ